MSLVRIAARMAAVEALKGATLVGDNVLDSQIGALDTDADGSLRTPEDKPFISIYTDDSKSSSGGLRSMLSNGATDFLFEAGITAAMIELDPDTGAQVMSGIGIPGTDADFEFHLDLVARQIGDALTDPENEWAEIWRLLVTDIASVHRQRTSSDSNGVRLAAQQLRVSVGLVNDPVTGSALSPEHGLSKFFSKAATMQDEDFRTKALAMQAQLNGSSVDWNVASRRYGMTIPEAENLQVRPTPDMMGNGNFVDVVIGMATS